MKFVYTISKIILNIKINHCLWFIVIGLVFVFTEDIHAQNVKKNSKLSNAPFITVSNPVLDRNPKVRSLPDSLVKRGNIRPPKLSGGISDEIIIEETFLPWINTQDSIRSIDKLRAQLDGIIRKYSNRRTKIGVAVYSMDREEFIYEHKSEQLYTPASTTKLFTVMSAFYLRGDNGTIDTELWTNGYMDMDTVLIGDLFIRGQGNPFLEGKHIQTLADRVRDMGIRRIDGNIYIDEGFFDGKTDRFKYSGDADVVQKLPPIRPLILADANLKLEVQAGDIVGDPVEYYFYPNSSVFEADNTAKVSASRSRGQLYVTDPVTGDIAVDTGGRLVEERFGDSPYQDFAGKRYRKNQSKRGVKVSQVLLKDTIQKYKINGSLPSGQIALFQYPIKDMQEAIAGTLENWLFEYGIDVEGVIAYKSINDYEENRVVRLGYHGFPLVEMAMPVNKKSNNFIAEQMFKFVGGNRNNDNNYEGSREVFVEMLDSLDIECKGCRLNDGSGLSRRGLLKPRAMAELLVASTKPPFTDKLRKTLAIAGVDGTIRKRMKNTKAQNNLIGKTGTLRNVSALSGFVNNQDGETYVFSILSNGSSPYKYKRMENEIGEALAEFYYTDGSGKRRP